MSHVLITGGCGFVGTNLAERLLASGRTVCLLDDLSRHGAERNLAWLRAGHGDRLRVEVADIRNAKVVRRAVRDASAVFHFATPGTLNVLKALRVQAEPPPLFFTSATAEPGDVRALGLRAVAFRISGIYGPHEFGTEEQGSVAQLVRRAIEGKTITVLGNGKDALFVEDLVDAFLAAWRHLDRTSGQAFDIGGGSASPTELVDAITRVAGVRPDVHFAPSPDGSASYGVPDTSRFRAATGWAPSVTLMTGVARLHAWLLAAQRTARLHLPALQETAPALQ